MSAEAVGWVWRNSPMRKSGLLVHLALADVTNDMHQNQLWCSVATLSDKTHLDRSTVMAALDMLVREGLLTETERPGRTTLYRFLTPVGFSDTLPEMRGGNPDTPVGESDTTRRKSRHELNRTQANHLAPPPEICGEWVAVEAEPIAGQRTPPATTARCILPADHQGDCRTKAALLAPTPIRSERADALTELERLRAEQFPKRADLA